MTPKIVGADVELSNFILGVEHEDGTGRQASRLLLNAIDGMPSNLSPAIESIDMGRKFLPENGSCVYIDSDHLEVALPETTSAFDHVAQWRAMIVKVRGAMARVAAQLPDGCRLQVLANSSDGQGNSYGAHLNVLISREAWNRIMHQRPHYLAYLASLQVSSIVITGQGKVGAERGRPPVDFQLAQRADFFQALLSIDTMVHRGIVNSRDEPLCGSADGSRRSLARLHGIFFDSTLCEVASVLRVGMMQMVTAMIEDGCVNHALALDDPLAALELFSRDPDLAATAPLVGGEMRTAVQLQRLFLEEAKGFAEGGRFDGIVPDWARLLALWEDTIERLEARDFATLSRRLDWVLKRRILSGVIERRPELTWQSPQIRMLDQLFASLDESDGLFWPLERAGKVDRVVDDAAIARAGVEPPADTRAWTRAHLLRVAGPDRVAQVDWDRVRVRRRIDRWPFVRFDSVHLPLPFASTCRDNAQHFLEGAPLEAVLESLNSVEESVWPYTMEIHHEHTRSSRH